MAKRTLCIFLISVCVIYGGSGIRRKRHLLSLWSMISSQTKRNPVDFIDYGNWCGLGGSGKTVDDIDRCCKDHDACYDEASASVCLRHRPHLVQYKWKLEEGKVTCENSKKKCDFFVCECDRKVAGCLANHLEMYKGENKRQRGLGRLLFGDN